MQPHTTVGFLSDVLDHSDLLSYHALPKKPVAPWLNNMVICRSGQTTVGFRKVALSDNRRHTLLAFSYVLAIAQPDQRTLASLVIVFQIWLHVCLRSEER